MIGFIDVIAPLIEREGGYSNRSADRGGPTNMGVTQRVYNGWRQKHGMPWRDVKDLERFEAVKIFKELYWDPSKCEKLPTTLRELHFDSAVNHGVTRAAKLLQDAVGVKQDGLIGPITLDAVESSNPELLKSRYVNARYRFYGEIIEHDDTQMANIDGWLRRMKHFSV